MKRLIVMSLIVSMVILVGVSVFAGDKKYEGKTMVVYVGISPYAREQIMEYIAPELKAKWGINLVAEELGSKNMLQKIVATKKNPSATVCGWDWPIGIQAAQMGLTAPIDVEKAPNLKKLPDWALYEEDGEVHVLSKGVISVGLLYNTEIFEEKGLKPPTSWSDLWREDLSGRVSITAPESTWGMAALVTIARWQGGGEENIDPGFEKLKTLLPHIHTIHTWSSELVKLMQLKEVWMGTTGSNMGSALRAEGFPAKWVAPKEGSPTVSGGMSIIKNAPYQDVAHDYINMFYSIVYQTRRALWAGYVSEIPEVWTVLSPKEKENFPITPEDFDTLITLDYGVVGEKVMEWTERFHKELE